jgi:hypothetical protein
MIGQWKRLRYGRGNSLLSVTVPYQKCEWSQTQDTGSGGVASEAGGEFRVMMMMMIDDGPRF